MERVESQAVHTSTAIQPERSEPVRAEILPLKERLIVNYLRDFVENEKESTIALVAGIRKIGRKKENTNDFL